jgi:hypothetical protein
MNRQLAYLAPLRQTGPSDLPDLPDLQGLEPKSRYM